MYQALTLPRIHLFTSRSRPWHAFSVFSKASKGHVYCSVKPTYPNRVYATVSKSTICQRPATKPLISTRYFSNKEPDANTEDSVPRLIDETVLQAVTSSRRESTSLREIIEQYFACSGTILEVSLPYESRPSEARRTVSTDIAVLQCESNVILIAHCAVIGGEDKITLSSGFTLNIAREKVRGEAVIITCAHTLEEIRQAVA
ncbi:hypothetical protein CPB83DRAFT_20674 [Crepidotus variabilis]|uniref:Uncharacterized protein n=1 Tax=Crepidotus variabilis TaxID=179855 RepID=A0A9P6EUM1_9AGAR|nr:hypothetical protein CPB83DRAFT_20674 [Crepidotus variabilis]